jgi:hypothetical protein
LESFDTHQLTAIAEFMARSTDLAYHHAARLRAETISAMGRTRGTLQATTLDSAGGTSEMNGRQPPVLPERLNNETQRSRNRK